MGEYNHTLDPKNRIIVPAKFRDDLGDTFIMSAGFDGCLYLTPKETWDAFTQKLAALPFTAETRKLQRHFMRNSMECEPDKQGRILIPQNLKEFAGLEKDAVMIGSITKIELWSKEKLDNMDDEEGTNDAAEKLFSEYNLSF